MTDKPKWDNLKESKCPLCDTRLDAEERNDKVYCLSRDCKFSIGAMKLRDILKEMTTPKQPYKEEPNREALNEL